MRVAVLVDAGYLYASGLKTITDEKLPRQKVQLDVKKTIYKLKEMAKQRAKNAELLRIYWYDGALDRGLSVEHKDIADSDDVKLRLGIINHYGKQKGVDSLIVTDLIDLARNHAIGHAVLLSGDEDTRIGVQIAQSFGVRVHLIGVVPCRVNQSQLLRQEADTTTELSKTDVETFLTLRPEVTGSGDDSDGKDPEPNVTDISGPPNLEDCVSKFVTGLSPDKLDDIAKLEPNAPIPQELDRKLLWTCGRSRSNNWLDEPEKHYVRNKVRELAKAAQTQS